jgi:hypothetical protein
MKNIFILIFLSIGFLAYSQLINEEELYLKIQSSEESCVGAHESIVLRINKELADFVWGKNVRLNNATVIKYFSYPSGEEVSALFDINLTKNKNWSYIYDQKTAADLLIDKGLRVSQSYNKVLINARQNLILAENIKDGYKVILELYCPHEEFLQGLRIGIPQSIEFQITGMLGSADTDLKILGVVTKVHSERQVLKCANGHEYDKASAYKFCPSCGEPLK